MSVTRGSSAEEYEPVLNIKGEDAKLVSGSLARRIVLDYAWQAGADTKETISEQSEQFFPFLGQFEDKVVGVNRIMVHIEANAGVDYAAAELGINDTPPQMARTVGEFSTPLANDMTQGFEFYTGASNFDGGSFDAGSQGDGHQYEHEWTPIEPHKFLMTIDETDSIYLSVVADTDNRVSVKWRLDYGIFEYL